jgi:hypothetical protein
VFVINFGDDNLVDLSEQADYEFPHPVQRWVMLLVVFEYADKMLVGAQALGTAFAIGPQLLVTARHVLDPVLADVHAAAPGLPPNMVLHAMFLTDELLLGKEAVHYLPIPISNVAMNASHDLAILTTRTLAPASGKQPVFMCAPLTTRAPAVGSYLFALGYAKARAVVTSVNEDGMPTIRIDQRVMASRGRVEERYGQGRDTVMINFPALQGDFPSLSGMSGGPVVAEDGHVCGVICSSVDSTDGTSWTSTCSLLPFLFTLPVKAQLDGVSGSWSIRDLAERGIVPTDGSYAKVQFEKDGQDLHVAWSIE